MMVVIAIGIAFVIGLVLGTVIGYGLCGMMLLAARYGEEEAEQYDGEHP